MINFNVISAVGAEFLVGANVPLELSGINIGDLVQFMGNEYTLTQTGKIVILSNATTVVTLSEA